MSTEGFERQAVAPDAVAPTRPMYWSVCRELWENRSIYLAPIGVAVVLFFGFVISAIGLPHRRRALLMLDPSKQRAAIVMPYDVAAIMLIVTAFIVGAFYCLDALYGERRDRSILFWKSLPVSDRTSVLAKITIPLAVLPAIVFIVAVTTQLLMLLWTTVLLLAHRMDPSSTWKYFNIVPQSAILLYGLVVIALWHAPIYAWLLLVSAWARRAPFLWAILPIFGLGIFETIAFHTHVVPFAIKYRLAGGFDEAFRAKPNGSIDSLAQLTPGHFLATPGLWIGLAFTAIFLFTASRLRRDREPI